MIFFYVGLGFAMMTTVISIFETSTNINKNQYTIRNKINYTENITLRRQNDKKFLQMLNDIKGSSLGSGQLICQNIKNGFTDQLNPNYSILSNYSVLNNYNYGVTSSSTHSRITNGCSLINGAHRVIIVPSSNEVNTYNLYSCIVEIDPRCPFELVN
tara:strand:- start:163 stop:633 length:471 start_codon:yes stop_codon:yes gene_type:complete